jgi:hypothetical protein
MDEASDDDMDIQEFFPSLFHSKDGDNSVQPTNSQQMTYTTVGSLVKADATPQFTAPIRMQREGNGRRQPLPVNQTRSFDPSLASRSYGQHFPPLEGSQYYPSPNRFTSNQQYQSPQASSTMDTPLDSFTASPFNHDLTMQEESVLSGLGMQQPQMRSGNIPTPTRPTISKLNSQAPPFVNDRKFTPFQFTAGHNQRDSEQAASSQASMAGMNKMQTIQRLAQYPNPMQKLAKGRLAEFSVSRLQASNDENHLPGGYQPGTASVGNQGTYFQTGKTLITEMDDMESDRLEDNKVDYYFPSAGLSNSSFPTTNPLFGSYENPVSMHQGFSTSQTRSYPQTEQGYPKPLSAGPPGHRQASFAQRLTTGSTETSLIEIFKKSSKDLSSIDAPEDNSPWADHSNSGYHGSYNSQIQAKVHDRSTKSWITDYYNGGVPANFNPGPDPVGFQTPRAYGPRDEHDPNV